MDGDQISKMRFPSSVIKISLKSHQCNAYLLQLFLNIIRILILNNMKVPGTVFNTFHQKSLYEKSEIVTIANSKQIKAV